ncbi:hypothetical protein ACMU_16390 [Actibacterium mucosum KCTC 23349]|uniref:MAPEG family protein n=1 Tax=Actibacterium mucosum KCTC 23349 TaxID=1454373 RepID=A0A037ZGE6_9RHOB|nr:MAPEG family protein [Actibacterium mucosum]KAJ54693.1 hypothetical protein ACMU_16390 [Actibacterium mucosum KCTC 23349]
MTNAMTLLTLILLATALMAFPYVLNRIAVRGLAGAMANPGTEDRALSAWADRAKAAHGNAIENLVVFAPALLAVEATGLANGATAIAASLYLVARVVHYIVYTMGIPVIRTLAFFGGWGATVFVIAQIGGLA